MTSRGDAQAAQVTERRTKALSMRVEGAPLAAIADALGYKTASAVSQDISRALAQRRAEMGEGADALRDMELERLDALWRAAWAVLEREHPTVSHGKVVTVTDGETGKSVTLRDDGPELAAIDRLLRVAESRRKLLGLDAAAKLDAGITVKYEVVGIEPDALT